MAGESLVLDPLKIRSFECCVEDDGVQSRQERWLEILLDGVILTTIKEWKIEEYLERKAAEASAGAE